MKKAIPWVLLIVIAGAAAWYWSVWQDQQQIEQAQVLPPPALPPEPEPIQYPVEQIETRPAPDPSPEPEPEPEPIPPPPALPTLEDSDEEMRAQIAGMVGDEALARHFVLEMMISRAVATVDSLTSAKVAPMVMPLNPPEGAFEVLGGGEEAAISPLNAERYQPYVDLLLSVDTETAVAAYVRYYPLFQEAWEAQGYPDSYFNDRLVAVLDQLLATPRPQELMSVVQNEAVFEFADPGLEALSSGQKMLLRLDAEQFDAVQDRLREFRAAIAGQSLEN